MCIRDSYVTEVNKLKDRFGDYLLFNSNFANVNPAPELRNRRFNKNTDPDLARQYNGFVEYRRKIFHEFQRVLPAISEQFADKKIIIRPHPSENPKFWNSFMERHSNIEVVRENTAIPWLLGAKAIIHNGCTTAAEAALLGKPAISYCPIMETEHEHVLSNEISIKLNPNYPETKTILDETQTILDETQKHLQQFELAMPVAFLSNGSQRACKTGFRHKGYSRMSSKRRYLRENTTKRPVPHAERTKDPSNWNASSVRSPY